MADYFGALELLDDCISVPVGLMRDFIDFRLPRILHPIGFRNVYRALEALQSANGGAESGILEKRALYHTRHQTEFYKSSQLNWLSGEI